ncbi:hypothetical protein [Yinghuangia seranimata]|uniref:hypothetical protein n=1 Tax=Yinghuangia seranimata TaxID=408067 RepID=UPI00248B25CE|nr:hypothetical protein [Yinghuangia seranimata]MDI2125719.1 hypothetical protein [Yinghuangia seranimata]
MDSEDSAPTVPSEHLVNRAGFWPAYLDPLLGTELDLTEAFGDDPADVDEMLGLLYGPDTSPQFTLPLADGYAIEIDVSNYGDADDLETSIFYTVAHTDWTRPGFLATLGIDESGPGLAWPEFHTAVHAPGAFDAHERTLLRAPILGDAATPRPEAEALLTAAFTACGANPDAVSALVDAVLDGAYFGDSEWIHPEGDDTGLLVCQDSNSARTLPIGQGGRTTDQARALARVLGTLGEGDSS